MSQQSQIVQVLERFSGVFRREDVVIRQFCKQLQQALTFHKKEREKMPMLKTLHSKKKDDFDVCAGVDERLNMVRI